MNIYKSSVNNTNKFVVNNNRVVLVPAVVQVSRNLNAAIYST